MSTKKPEWVVRKHLYAFCNRCKGVSHFVRLNNWFVSGKDMTYWRWYNAFKKQHRECKQRIK